MKRPTEVSHAERRKSPQQWLQWASERFPGRVAVSSSFQTQSVPLLHMLSEAAPDVPVLFLDTGYHFPETLAFRDRLVQAWGLRLEVLRGDKALEARSATTSDPLYATDADRCCWINKVAPMQAAMSRYPAWISGIRRDQSPARAAMEHVEETDGRTRIHPLLDWTGADIERYTSVHELPRHPLTERGYGSIGCQPCTEPGSGRSGRWAGAKTECGLHTHLSPTSRRDQT